VPNISKPSIAQFVLSEFHDHAGYFLSSRQLLLTGLNTQIPIPSGSVQTIPLG